MFTVSRGIKKTRVNTKLLFAVCHLTSVSQMQLSYAASAGDVCGIMRFLQISGGFPIFLFFKFLKGKHCSRHLCCESVPVM